MKPLSEHDAGSLASAFQGVELVRAVERQIAANLAADPDSLESSVKYLLEKCPYTVRDMSGERTGARWLEDLTGSLVLTFMGMEHRLKMTKESK